MTPPLPGPRGFTFLRFMLLFQRNSLVALDAAQRIYGDIVKFPWPVNTVLIYSPALIRQVLIENNLNFGKGKQTDQLKPLLGESLATNSDRQEWLKSRTAVSREMGNRAVEGFSHIIRDYARISLQDWHEKKEMNISKQIGELTFKVATRTLFGTGLAQEDGLLIEKAVRLSTELAHEHMFKLLPWPYWVPTPKNVRYHLHKRKLNRIIRRIVADMRTQAPTVGDSNILSRLVLSHSFDDLSVRNEVLTLLLAGYETTYATICWVLALLADRPEMQELVAEEVRSLPDISGMEFCKTHPWLYRSILEGMRLYPAFGMISRANVSADELQGHALPPKTSVVIPIWTLHRDPRHWKEPLRFTPERFEGVDASQLEAYMPFSKGPRRCVGEILAMVKSAIVISEVLRRYEVRLDGQLPEAISQVSIRPARDIVLTLSPRSM